MRSGRRNTEPEHEPRGGVVRSSRDDRKKDRDFFCCVTTRHRGRHPWPAETARRPGGGVPADCARRQRVAGGLPGEFVVSADAWRPATAAIPAGTRDRRNNADSNAAAGSCHRSPCADRLAAQAVSFWSMTSRRDYADRVPRELLSPEGAARGTLQSRSGTFFTIPAGWRPPSL